MVAASSQGGQACDAGGGGTLLRRGKSQEDGRKSQDMEAEEGGAQEVRCRRW